MLLQDFNEIDRYLRPNPRFVLPKDIEDKKWGRKKRKNQLLENYIDFGN
jgi:hypothetical protein